MRASGSLARNVLNANCGAHAAALAWRTTGWLACMPLAPLPQHCRRWWLAASRCLTGDVLRFVQPINYTAMPNRQALFRGGVGLVELYPAPAGEQDKQQT